MKRFFMLKGAMNNTHNNYNRYYEPETPQAPPLLQVVALQHDSQTGILPSSSRSKSRLNESGSVSLTLTALLPTTGTGGPLKPFMALHIY